MTGDPSGAPVSPARVRVAVPSALRALARIDGEVAVEVETDAGRDVTVAAVLDALETRHPTLAGTVRDRATGDRRAMIRLYAGGDDFSDVMSGRPLPPAVVDGREPLRIVGSIAGG